MNVQASLALAILAATPLLFAALGELLYEKVGLLNAGVEGVMLMGAVSAYAVAIETSNLVLALLGSAAVCAVFTLLLYGVPVLLMAASQILVSFAVWFIGTGLSSQIGLSYQDQVLFIGFEPISIPLLADIPWVGPILFEQPWPVYASWVLVGIVAFVLNKTNHGLNMRSIGEDPASAHAAGVAVKPWQSIHIAIGGALMGIGGGVLCIEAQSWRPEMTSGRGFVAFALVIFAGWRALGLLWASFFFGFLLILGDVGQANGWSIPSPFLAMMPYAFTVVILIFRTWREIAKSGTTSAPAALGQIFVRGQR